VYSYEHTSDVADQLAELPGDLVLRYMELISFLTLTPWSGPPYKSDNPDGAMRVMDIGPDGECQVTYLVLEDERRVVVLNVVWMR
jgi:hypothetical protein